MTIYTLDGIAPEMDEESWVAPGAHVIGNVWIGPGAGIWFGAVLRGDNEPILVGQGTNIQDNAVCHTDIGFPLNIGPGCTIGHKAILHGCSIGENTLVGMGATILNGARIGKNCLIGAGALITEGREIPNGSLVIGSPGKVKRDLTEEEIEGLRESAKGYTENMKRFKAGLAVEEQ